MSNLPNDLSGITIDDVRQLVQNSVMECRDLEYKAELPGATDADKREFLADVSSFANSSGGHIVYGVTDRNGKPDEISAIAGNADAARLRLEQVLASGLRPRLLGAHFEAIAIERDRFVLVMRVPQSLQRPHMVVYNDSGRFWGRNSGGKYRLDVDELRRLFAWSEGLADRVRSFQADRIVRILDGQAPASLPRAPRLVLHVLPLSSLEPGAAVDLRLVDGAGRGAGRPWALGESGCNWSRPNFDGLVVCHATSSAQIERSYCQLFRSGAIESVEMIVGPTGLVAGSAMEADVLVAVERYRATLLHLGVEPPVVLMLALLSVKGCQFALPRGLMEHHRPYPGGIDRDHLLPPAVLVESWDFEPAQVMRSTFDTLWNAEGWLGSPNYDEDGNRQD